MKSTYVFIVLHARKFIDSISCPTASRSNPDSASNQFALSAS